MKRFIALAILLFCANQTLAQTTRIEFNGVDGALLENVRKSVRLVERVKTEVTAPISESERYRLVSQVENQIEKALQPYGYYLVNVTADLSQAPETYYYTIDLGEAVTVAKLNINVIQTNDNEDRFDEWRDNYPLNVGEKLEQSKYESAKKSLLALAIQNGYFDAQFLVSEIRINESRTSADIVLSFDCGQRYRFGELSYQWAQEDTDYNEHKYLVDEALLQSLVTFEEGDYYTSESLADTRRNFIGTSYFSTISIDANQRIEASGEVPVKITLVPNKLKAYSFTIGAGTDTGPRGSIGYENRRINSAGHRVNLRLGGSEIERSAIVNYRIPLERSEQDSLNFFSTLEEEIGDTRQFESSSVGTEWVREWDKALLKFGLTLSREKSIRQLDDLSEEQLNTDLLMPSANWDRSKSDNLYFPTKGWSLSAALRIADKNVVSDLDLAQATLDAKYLRPLGPGRIKIRFKLGATLIDESIDLPESLGFLAGGDDSIRGYKYESIGVTRNNETGVGKNINIASIEYEHPIRNGFGIAGFIDAGDAFDSNPDYKKGAGFGLRWRLPFGSLRLDAASALDLDGDPWRLHFSFGTDL